MTLTFSSIQPEDLETLAQIWTRGWHQTHADICPKALVELRTYASFLDRLSSFDGDSIVARQDNAIQGFSLIRANEVYQFFVDRPAQGRGVARELMNASLQRIQNANYTTAVLDCSIGNDMAARFYEKMGWNNTGTHMAEL
ncbi:MAG: GNAT family N-acetyltransferase, partial [Planktomarina sp.]